jgi:hypothetical protein
VESTIRAGIPGCENWGTDTCGECEIPIWCGIIDVAYRCDTPICCGGNTILTDSSGNTAGCRPSCCDVEPSYL